MMVSFIGAGPGDPELLTIRGRRLIEKAPVCLYAGSLVPPAIVAHAPKEARVLDTASMTLDEIEVEFLRAAARDEDVARIHSGDPSLYGAIAEQIRRLGRHGIGWQIIPGVPSFAAAAAALGQELTLPGVAQSVVLTRTAMKASPMPEGEDLETLARSRATLVIHLSIRNIRALSRRLAPFYGANCPVAVVYRVGWPDAQILHGTLSDIRGKVREAGITRTALVIVGKVLSAAPDAENFSDSALYDPGHTHLLRAGKA